MFNQNQYDFNQKLSPMQRQGIGQLYPNQNNSYGVMSEPPLIKNSVMNGDFNNAMTGTIQNQDIPWMNDQDGYLPRYANGGAVKSIVDYLKQAGEGEDKILAHINPEEAKILSQNYGYDINPVTGLPQFGFFKKMIKPLARIAAPVIGSFFGGPAGAIGLSALHGMTERGKGNKLKGALGGAGRGAAFAALAPMAGNAMGLSPTSFMGKGLGMNTPSFLHQLGLKSAPSMGGGLGFFGNGAGNTGLVEKHFLSDGRFLGSTRGMGGAAGNASGGGFFGGHLLDSGLLGMMGLGALLRKEKPVKEESMQEYVARNRPQWGPQHQSRNVVPVNRKYQPKRDPLEDAEHLYYDDINPPVQTYADGGAVDGYTDGQADKIPALLSDGEYVIPTYAVSRLGDGNTNAGFKKLDDFVDNVMRDAGSEINPPKVKSISQYFSRR